MMRNNIKVFIALWLIPIFILWVFRCVFVVRYLPLTELQSGIRHLPLALMNSMRFDMLVAGYVMLVPLILICLHRKEIAVYMAFIAAILSTACIADLGFYHNFNSHFNITLFDFFNEGPKELLRVIWEEYHVLCYIGIVILITYLTFKYSKYVMARLKPITEKWTRLSFSLLGIVFLFVCMRGSVTEFPLQIEDTIISPSQALNNAVPNAPYMLKDAWKSKNNAFRLEDCQELLNDYRFNTLSEAVKEFNNDAIVYADTFKTLQNALFAYQPRNEHHECPNVLIILAESWSNYLIELDSDKDNMLYGMRRHFNEDILFRNYQSVCNGTIASIENIVLSTPFPRMFSSKYSYSPISTCITNPFTESGYTCKFFSGMDQAWEHCGDALKRQGFKQVVGKYELLEKSTNYKYNPVGVYDHFLLNSILAELKSKSSLPRFLLAMTTTNHPPFVYPDDIELAPLDKSFYKKDCFNNVGDDVLSKYITGFRYFNKVLGDFLTEFKKSPVSNNTIVVVTGDHNVRSILNYSKIGNRWKNSVPLYIYLPPRLRKDDYPEIKDKWGCHYDIIATLAPIALSDTYYLKLGNDMLSDTLSLDNTYSFNEQQVLANKDYEKKARRQADARNVLLRLYFKYILSR